MHLPGQTLGDRESIDGRIPHCHTADHLGDIDSVKYAVIDCVDKTVDRTAPGDPDGHTGFKKGRNQYGSCLAADIDRLVEIEIRSDYDRISEVERLTQFIGKFIVLADRRLDDDLDDTLFLGIFDQSGNGRARCANDRTDLLLRQTALIVEFSNIFQYIIVSVHNNIIYQSKGVDMVSQEFTVKNPTGIHARPASMLVQLCSKINDEISIVTQDQKTVNPKSILSVLMGGMAKGMKITVNVEGENEEESLKQIIELLDSFTE